jgi:hypothetical protein
MPLAIISTGSGGIYQRFPNTSSQSPMSSLSRIVSDTGQTNNAWCGDNLQMKHTIEDVSRKDAGILVAFEDGVVAFFDPSFLYAQLDKRVLSSKTTPRQKKQE